jgi:hypothetical protein
MEHMIQPTEGDEHVDEERAKILETFKIQNLLAACKKINRTQKDEKHRQVCFQFGVKNIGGRAGRGVRPCEKFVHFAKK